MADDFGQTIQGLHLDGGTIAAGDQHIAVFGKDFTNSTYEYLKIDPTSGALWVTDGGSDFGVVTNFEYAEDTAHTDGDVGAFTLAVRNDTLAALAGSDGDYAPLQVNANGALYVAVDGTVTISGAVTTNYEYAEDSAHSSADIGAFVLAVRNDAGTALAADGDYIPLSTDANGALRVSGTFAVGREDSTQHYNTATLVKDTPNVVVSVSPGTTQNFIGALVSGAGYCEWEIQFGTTSSEATIFKFWTTPSHPTEYLAFPEMIAVTSTQTIRVRGTNRENKPSTGSDFAGYATLVRETVT